jgi:hypothetical protein
VQQQQEDAAGREQKVVGVGEHPRERREERGGANESAVRPKPKTLGPEY